jgi:signal peptidase I
MEERLLFIGAALGLFAWRSRLWKQKGGPATPAESAAWHALFYAVAAFSIALILTMVLDTRAKVVAVWGKTLRVGDLVPATAAALLAAGFGGWRAWSRGESVESRRFYLDDDLEWAETVYSSALLAWALMTFVLQAFKIPSSSMENTLLIGDHLFVNKFVYGLRLPVTGHKVVPFAAVSRGDVVVFEFPVPDPREPHCGKINAGENLSKRVIGLPGETIRVRGGRVFVDDKPLDEERYAVFADRARIPESIASIEVGPVRYQELWQSHKLDGVLGETVRDYMGPVKVPAGHYFMMGDNRDHSCDSRYWGPVPDRYFKGKAWFKYWPPSRAGGVR